MPNGTIPGSRHDGFAFRARGCTGLLAFAAAAVIVGAMTQGCANRKPERLGWIASFESDDRGKLGLVQVREANGTVHVRGQVEGLEPGPYLLVLDIDGNCAEAPEGVLQAGLRYEDMRGIGGSGPGPEAEEPILPILLFAADRKGRARVDFTTSRQGLGWGGGSILGKAFEIRRAYPADGMRLRPAGAGDGAGEAVACGRVMP